VPADITGVELKIERAKKHLRDLETTLEGFGKTDPYAVVVEDNPESGYREHKVIRAEAPPACLALICGDVIHNLRSALDHLIRQLIIANPRSGIDPDNVRSEFPVGATKANYESRRAGNTNGISKTALRVLDGLKPYKGGNDALWAIHYLDIVDKHRLLLTVSAANRGMFFDPVPALRRNILDKPEFAEMLAGLDDLGSVPIQYDWSDEWTALRIGAVILRAPLGDDLHDNLKLVASVTLNEPEIPRGQSITPALQQLIDATEAVVLKLGAEVR
jgi:hypothetical protein